MGLGLGLSEGPIQALLFLRVEIEVGCAGTSAPRSELRASAKAIRGSSVTIADVKDVQRVANVRDVQMFAMFSDVATVFV